MLVFFTTSVFLGFLGVLIMFASLVVFWTNVRRMGKAGWEEIACCGPTASATPSTTPAVGCATAFAATASPLAHPAR